MLKAEDLSCFKARTKALKHNTCSRPLLSHGDTRDAEDIRRSCPLPALHVGIMRLLNGRHRKILSEARTVPACRPSTRRALQQVQCTTRVTEQVTHCARTYRHAPLIHITAQGSN
jgi:hypothetical protein